VTLLELGLASRIGARLAGRVIPEAHSTVRDISTGVVNAQAIRDYSRRLASSVDLLLDAGEFPVVLGGDCSILLGPMSALRSRGRYGLLFVDGHSDFYSGRTSPTGEAADMDLAIVTGRGPVTLTDWEAGTPLVRDEDVVLVGVRDTTEAGKDAAESVNATQMLQFELNHVRELGIPETMRRALAVLDGGQLDGFWIHLDVDVLDDAVMPAVDYRMPGGLSLQELVEVVATAVASPRALGMEVTIFNPTLDATGQAGTMLVHCLVDALRPSRMRAE